MENGWTTHAQATNVHFRIIKNGNLTRLYERTWKTADVGLSSNNDNNYVLSVTYKYGKRIDILLHEEMSSFQIQGDSVIIFNETKQTKFCLKKLSAQTAAKVKEFLHKVMQAKRKVELTPNKRIKKESLTETNSNLSPSPTRPSDLKRSYGAKNGPPPSILCMSGGKRHRSSLNQESETKPVDSDKYDEKPRANSEMKKIADFRKAKAAVKRSTSRYHSESEALSGKENISPHSKSDPSLDKHSFYGSHNDNSTSFAEKMQSVKIQISTPSPKAKRNPFNTPPRSGSSSSSSSSSARRSLLLGDKKVKKEDFGDLEICVKLDSQFSDNNNNNSNNIEGRTDFPLNDKANISLQSSSGFENLGNTCYLNSTLQSLFRLLPFRRDLLNLGRDVHDSLSPDSTFMAIFNLINHKSTSSPEKSLLLRRVKEVISAKSKQFHGFAQQDAHEFLRMCLDLIQEDVKRLNHIAIENAPNTGGRGNENAIPESILQDKHKCPVTSNFSMVIKKELKCSNCEANLTKEEEQYDLPVELRGKPSSYRVLRLQKLVNLTFSAEDIEYNCEKCKHDKATVTKVVTRLPRIMMVYLKRYSYNQANDQSVKLAQKVSVPRYLTFNQLRDKATKEHFPSSSDSSSSLDEDIPIIRKPEKRRSAFAKVVKTVGTVVPMKAEPKVKDAETDLVPNLDKSDPEKVDDAESKHVTLEEAVNRHFAEAEQEENADEDLRNVIELSRREFYEPKAHHSSAVRGIKELNSMTEDEQFALAVQLSMQEEEDNLSLFGSLEKSNSADSGHASNEGKKEEFEKVHQISADSLEASDVDSMTNNTPGSSTANSSHSKAESSVAKNDDDQGSLAMGDGLFGCISPLSKATSETDQDSVVPNLSSTRKKLSSSAGTSSTATIGSTSLDAFFSDTEAEHVFSSEREQFIAPGAQEGECLSRRVKRPVAASRARAASIILDSLPNNEREIPTRSSPDGEPGSAFFESHAVQSMIRNELYLDQPFWNRKSSSERSSSLEASDEEVNEMLKNESTGHLPHSYRIVSIVSHKGGSSKFGHYISDVLTDYANNKWHCFDDKYVDAVNEEDVLFDRQSTCYLLFYIRKELLQPKKKT